MVLSQKDVRELQLGKGAMRAGIEILLKELSLEAGQVEQVLLAGAFGAYLSPAALCDIDLFPEEFRNRTKSIGNAAGEGAKLYAKNFALFEESETLARGTEYIELSSCHAFTDQYVNAMAFPRTGNNIKKAARHEDYRSDKKRSNALLRGVSAQGGQAA